MQMFTGINSLKNTSQTRYNHNARVTKATIVAFGMMLPLLCWLIVQPTSSYAQYIAAEPFENGIVSSADLRASQAGIDILKMGGNAVDAAVAVHFALAVTTPRAGNIGGGGFLVYRTAEGDVYALDFREKAPGRATKTMYQDDDGNVISEASKVGALASGVPGSVDGMISALERYGSLPLEVVLEPAIRLAAEGVILNHVQAEDLNSKADLFSRFDASAATFMRGDSLSWRRGDLLMQPDLAETLRRIAAFGRDGFYAGPTAAAIVREMRRQGGIISLADLRDYESVWRDPVQVDYRDYTLFLMPPPSSGGIVIAQILDMMNQYEALRVERSVDNQDAAYTYNNAASIHLLAEMMRRSFADRNFHLGDPDFAKPPDSLLSSDYLMERVRTIDPSRATPSDSVQPGNFGPLSESGETTHFSVMDKDGAAVAVTTTLNGSFGSGVTVHGAGFLLNNEMDDFSAKPGVPNMFGLVGAEANEIAPGKRMLSSMTPMIVTKENRPVIVTGAAGGPRIITAVLQQFLNVALYDMDPVHSVYAPRFHHQWLPDILYAEPFAFTSDTKMLLESMGHQVEGRTTIGRIHSVFMDDKGIRYGVADPRGEGDVAGY